jgi:thiamine-monophosphate kinase
VHASVPRKPEARPITAAPPAYAGSYDLPTRQSGAFLTHLSLSSLGERALIRRITSRLAASLPAPAWVLVGPGDDAAVIEPERGALDVLTTDAIVEGIHFDRAFVPLDAVGHRALAVNLSDLAAMGARPRAALLSLVLPEALDVEGIDHLLDGLLALAAKHAVAVIGGNITRSPGPLVIDVTAIGSVRPRRVLTRAGARPGDEVYVTGSLGAAAVGLKLLQSDGERGADLVPPTPLAPARLAEAEREGGRSAGASLTRLAPQPNECIDRYLRPIPRVRAGMLLGRNRAATSCMDLSDGLADAVRQVAEASNVGMTIDATALPIPECAREWHGQNGGTAIDMALTGGDDYELLFTVRPSQRGRLRGVRRQVGDLPITRIGVVTRHHDLLLKGHGPARELPHGYEHFR